MGEMADFYNEQGMAAIYDHEIHGCDASCDDGAGNCVYEQCGPLPRASSVSPDWKRISVNGRERFVLPPKCPYCASIARYTDSIAVYKTRSYGMIWLCWNYPTCDAYVGAHKNSGWPLGRLADAELRKWKKDAHAAFDTRWQMQVEFGGASKRQARSAAYRWLQEQMGLSEQECHIGRFDIEQCKKVVEVCK